MRGQRKCEKPSEAYKQYRAASLKLSGSDVRRYVAISKSEEYVGQDNAHSIYALGAGTRVTEMISEARTVHRTEEFWHTAHPEQYDGLRRSSLGLVHSRKMPGGLPRPQSDRQR